MLGQFVLNGLVAASVYVVVGLGFGVIYRVEGFFHFAHGIVFTAGPYAAFFARAQLGLPLLPSALVGVAASGLIGGLIELLLYRPMRRRSASPLVLLLASLGVYTVFQNLISLGFGDDTKVLRPPVVEEGVPLLGGRITATQLLAVLLCAVLSVGLLLLLRCTRLGRAIRAVGADRDLAGTSGVETNQVILWAVGLGSVLAGVAGLLYGLDVDLRPTMGMYPLMMGVIAVIIGGARSVPGVVASGLLLGLAQHLGAWVVGSQWQDSVAFIILLCFLVFRPRRFRSRTTRTPSV